MNVTLSPEIEDLVRQKVESGDYSDEQEVVEAALRQMIEADKLKWLRTEIAKGLADIERGDTVLYTPQLFEEIRQRAYENARLGKPVKDAAKP